MFFSRKKQFSEIFKFFSYLNYEFSTLRSEKTKKSKITGKFLLRILNVYSLLQKTAWVISQNWRRKNILLFTIVNRKYDSKIQLTTAISKNVENKIF